MWLAMLVVLVIMFGMMVLVVVVKAEVEGIVGGGDLAMTLVSRQARAPGAPPAEEVGLQPPACPEVSTGAVCVWARPTRV